MNAPHKTEAEERLMDVCMCGYETDLVDEPVVYTTWVIVELALKYKNLITAYSGRLSAF